MAQFQAALIQFHWRPSPEENLAYILSTIDDIGRNQEVEVVCLPEFFMGPPFYFPGKGHLKGEIDDTIPGRITDKLGDLCRKHGFYVLGGTLVEREGPRYYNTSAVISPGGEVVAKSRKLHCFSAEMLTVSPGTEQVVVDTPFGKIGVCVCSDFWIQEMPRMLALKGAEIIYVSGSSLVQNLQAVRPCVFANSVQNVCYTLYTSVVGKVAGKRSNEAKFNIEFGGHTCAAAPTAILGALEDEEEVLFVPLDTEEIHRQRRVDVKFKNTLFWCLWGRRPELYQDILKPYAEAAASPTLKDLVGQYLGD